jgi:ferritin-like metal-binding protein YciE
MAVLDSLQKALQEQLRDLYSAENQLVKALPKMAKAASSDALREAITNHLDETRGHVDRLQEAARLMDFKPGGKRCKAMEGLIEEGKEVLDEEGDESVIDVALIAAAQRVEHYEIAAYGTARAMAEKLGNAEVARLLQETLDEEGAADKKLTAISVSEVLSAAARAGEGRDGEE